MAPLTVAAAVLLHMAQPSPAIENVAQWQAIIAQAARRFAIPAAWIARVMQSESRGQTILNGKPITSPAGAMGPMQLMPATYANLRVRFGLGPDPYAPHDNIFAGAAYLRDMYQRFGYPLLFAAYNAGPHRVEDYLARRRTLPPETLAYVSSVVRGWSPSPEPATAAPRKPVHDTIGVASNPLFFALSGGSVAASSDPAPLSSSVNPITDRPIAEPSAPAALFVPLTTRTP